MLNQARADVVKLLKKSGLTIAPDALVYPPKAEMGELSLPLFQVAKAQGKNPAEFAHELAAAAKPSGLIGEIRAVGPYVNFFLNRQAIAKEIFSGKKEKIRARKEKIMVEFITPNVNKPLHLGHLRNAFLGESISRLLESSGSTVIRNNLMNDIGSAVMKAAYAYKEWNNGQTPKKRGVSGDRFVGDLYVQFDKQIKKNPGDEKQKPAELLAVEDMVRQWEAGDKKVVALWKKIVGWAMAGQGATLKRIGISFGATFYESKIWKQGKAVAIAAAKKNIFKQDPSGAIIATFPETKLPDKVVLRSDGTNIYVTADLVLGDLKFKKYPLNRALWVTAYEQDLYFEQLFAMYRQLGFKWADKCEHVSYGFVNLPHGRMKSREGTVVDADDLLNELRDLALEEIIKRESGKIRNPQSVIRNIAFKKRAELIGQAALRFFLLSVGPKNTMVYNPAESLSFTGKTGPYLLYTYARLNSILKKTKKTSITAKSVPLSEIEWSLMSHLTHFDEIVAQAAKHRDPSLIATYTYELAKLFADFYETTPVLKAEDKDIRAMRIKLITRIKETLSSGLHLLTITPLERM